MRAHRTVLLIHPDPDRLSELAAPLAAELDVVTACSPSDTWGVLASRPVDLVAADASVGVEFLDELEQRAPGVPRAILFEGAVPGEWIAAMSDGHIFFALPEIRPVALKSQLCALAYPRVAERTLAGRGWSVELDLDAAAAPLVRPVIDVSNQGLAFRLEPEDDLERLLPGCTVPELRVRAAGALLLSTRGAIVRHVRPHGAPDGETSRGYAVGLEFPCEFPTIRIPSEAVRDPVRRSALLQEALRCGRLRLSRAEEDDPGREVVRGRIDPGAESLLVEGAFPAEWRPGDVLQGSFDADGATWFFLTTMQPERDFSHLSTQAGLRIAPVALPRVIRGVRRRQTNRYRPALNAGMAVEVAPLAGEPVRRPVLDINAAGLAFLAGYRHDLFPIGTVLPELRLHVAGDTVLTTRGRVVSHAPVAAGSGSDDAFKCGVQFEQLTPLEQAGIANAVLNAGFPGVHDARDLDFDGLWAFLRECGFLYPEKEAKLRPVLPEIRRTLSTLLQRPNPALQTLLFKTGDQLQGHISAVRSYRNTWFVQHLAARKDGPGRLAAARMLSLGIVEFSHQVPEMEWLRMWFRPNNKWPARVFGRFARLNFDPNTCDIRTYNYLVAPATSGPAEAPPAGLVVAPATAEDRAWIEAWFVSTAQSIALRADDLCRDRLLLEDTSRLYRSLGLERRREVYVARRRGGAVAGFAFAEIASLGLNFSELTNGLRVFVPDGDPQVVAALAARCRARYAELGRPLAVALSESPDLSGFEAAGFRKVKEYCCWTAHRSLFRRYCEYMQRIYERAQARQLVTGSVAV
jgi:hypothetical protein